MSLVDGYFVYEEECSVAFGTVPFGHAVLYKSLDLYVTSLGGGKVKLVVIDLIGVLLCHGRILLAEDLGVLLAIHRGGDGDASCIKHPVAFLNAGVEGYLTDLFGFL